MVAGGVVVPPQRRGVVAQGTAYSIRLPILPGLPPASESSDPPLTELETIDSARELATAEQPAFARIGRYVLLRRLGAGAMGYVHAGYDEILDRKVAIKLIHDEYAHSQHARGRLLREAKAMARVSHRNVAQVFEAGEHAGRVYLVMEFVAGQTLRATLEEAGPSRDWASVVRMFVRVGEGLAAAHRAGVTHRDFKPDNVLVGSDGEPKVLDFGLAGVGGGADLRVVQLSPRPRTTELTLTRTGAAIGTPAYMSPEQHSGERADEQSDQFAFFVSLFEALYGRRPFVGDDLTELAINVMEGRAEAAPSDTTVPAWLRDAVRRGLSRRPADRFEDMAEVIRVLRHRPASWRRPAMLAAVGAFGAVGAFAMWPQGQAPCEGAAERVGAAWDSAAVEAQIRGTALPFAVQTWKRVDARVAEYTDAWARGYEDACSATNVRRDQSVAVMDLRMACLHRARLDFEAVADVLADADADVVRRADDVVAGLPDVSRCSDIDALQAAVLRPRPEDKAAVQVVDSIVARARALTDAGKYEQARILLTDAPVVEHAPTAAAVQLALGEALEGVGDFVGSEAALREALRIATGAGEWRNMYAAALSLTAVVADGAHRPTEALVFGDLALILAERLRNPEHRVKAAGNRVLALRKATRYAEAEDELRRLLAEDVAILEQDPLGVALTRLNLGLVLAEGGKARAAEAEVRAAVEGYSRVLGPEHPRTVKARMTLASALYEQGRYAEAETVCREVIEQTIRSLGAEHPILGQLQKNLGVALREQGKLAESARVLRAAVTTGESAYGGDNMQTLAALNSLALTLDAMGRHAEAADEFRVAIARLSRAIPVDEDMLSRLRLNLGLAYKNSGRQEDAEVEYRAALKISLRLYGGDHPSTLLARANLGDLFLAQGKIPEAEAELRIAIERGDLVHGANHPDTILWRTVLGSALADTKPTEARGLLEAAWARRQQERGVNPSLRAMTAYELAKVLWTTPRDRSRAHQLAQAARETLAAAEGDHSAALTDIDAWLAAHPANFARATGSQR